MITNFSYGHFTRLIMRETNLEPFENDTKPGRAWLREVLKPARRGFREAIVVSLFINLLALAVPIFILQVYDRVVFHHGISTLQALLIGVILALVFDFLLRQARSRLLQRVALQIDVFLGKALFSRIASLPLKNLESRPSGFWHTLFKDGELIRNTFSGATAVLLTDLPFAILFIGLIAIIAPPIVWVLLIAIPIFIIVAIISGILIDRATQKERKSGISRDAFLAEMLQGRTTIRSLGIDKALKIEWEKKHASSIEQATARGRKMDGLSNFGTLLSMLTTVSLVTVGALAIIDLELTIGALIASTMLGNRIIGPFNQLVSFWRSYSGVIQAMKRLDSVFALPKDLETSSVQLPKSKGSISMQGVSFSYSPESTNVIDGISLQIKAPCILGVVGQNGSGKTTLLKLMQGLYKTQHGRILLDGADINQFGRRDLIRSIGYVPQECFLFSGSIRENITLSNTNATDTEILRAAEIAGVHEYIIDLPDGYDTQIGEGGSRLSGGQRQRIAIARALLTDPPILLLDEVTANLDNQAQTALRLTLMELAKNRTIIIVTHNPILLTACTNLIVLERGKVSVGGAAKDVLAHLSKPENSSKNPDRNPKKEDKRDIKV
ncbi:MAG: type I secretion system ATPase [Rhodospirillaceae bacterium]|nr:type I secretion system ATPase [Rhodospirillaceae bacterium]